MSTAEIQTAAEKLAQAQRLMALTGAGVSAESGIPTFRGKGGLWEGFRAQDLATPEAFARDPARIWRWYRWRRRLCLEAKPNPAHETLAAMDPAFPEFLLATQNVDGLHRRAGSDRILEFHGNLHQGRCTACDLVAPLPEEPEPDDAPLPRCAQCDAPIRPHVVWFGESYRPGVLEDATAFATHADVLLVAGTSAQVWPPAAIALHGQAQGAFLIDVNPEPTSISVEADTHLLGPAGEILPALWEAVRELRA